MSYTLSVYTDTTFKELFLPSISNADYTLLLERGDFSIQHDIKLKLEVVDEKWSIFAVKNEYELFQNGDSKDVIELKNKCSFKIKTVDNLEFSFVAVFGDRSIETIGKYEILQNTSITIGKNADCDIHYEGIGLVSRVHARISMEGGSLYIYDSSLNGVFVGTKRIDSKVRLNFGDSVNIFGLHIICIGNIIAINASYGDVKINERVLKACDAAKYYYSAVYPDKVPERQFFHRSPRNMPVINKDKITIEAPPAPKMVNERPLWMTIGPAFTMAIPMLLGCTMAILAMRNSGGSAGAFMYTGIITAISSAIIGVIWAVVNMKYAKSSGAKEEMNRFERYSDYLVEIADDLKNKYQENASAYYTMYPSAEECCNYTKDNPQLWNRNKTHADFLYERLGIGDIPFEVEITAPEIKFSLVADELAKKPQMLKSSYKTLQNVPVGIDLLRNHLIGIIGDNKKRNAIQIARNIAVQIAANNCYTDVKMVFVYDGADRELAQEWSFAKWIPHVWSEDRKSRYIATNKNEAGDIFYELAKIIRSRAEDENVVKASKDETICPKPYYIIFIADPELLEGELISKYIFNSQACYGLTTLLLDESYENLPNACEYVVENSNHFKGAYSMTGGRQTGDAIQFDFVSLSSTESFARRLLGIEVMEIENGGEIPYSLSFFDMYNVTSLSQFQILERWRKNRTYDSMKALVGKKAGNSDCYLDIHEKYHGPHGLIAGTTGSGKSETLQTYMLSLAINYSPEDIGFFVIDFKGGGMANLFNKLPHMVGQISNLSGNQVRRAMLSIKSENLRRQRIFSEFGVNHINSYTRLLKNQEATEPIPHLFIIIDEFAELKREEPEFMRELISVAQVGRSLGVHLILATQKPSGTVDDNIWSNSKFRLCLRVQDRQDSFDMLHRHDAAYLTNSGRCFLQVGNDEIFELFQSGWSGAVYDENMSNRSDIATMLAPTGKAAVVGNRVKFKQKENMRLRFLSLLAVHLINAQSVLDVSDEQILNDSSVRNTVVENAYETIEKSDLDYAYSKYNIQRLEEYLKKLVQISSGNLDEDVKTVVGLSREKGFKLPEFKDKTQLDAIVEYIAETAKENGYKNDITLWMPVLPTKMYLNQLDGYKAFDGRWNENAEKWDLEVVIGLCDDPENQNQFPLVLNFAENGNYAVCGTIVCGKSTFMQSALFALINKYSPKQVNIYALDFSSRLLSAFENSVQFGGVMYENDIDKINKFFNMIDKELVSRKEKLKGGNYQQYIQTHGYEIPSIIIAIDNYANFREKTNNAFDDDLLRISRDGVSYGIFLFVSSAGFGSAEIPNRMGDNIRNVLCLEMGDRFKYSDTLHITHIDILPEADVCGRGLVNTGSNVLEFQTALSLQADDDYKRMEKIKEVCQKINASWNGKPAKKVPEIPEHSVWGDFEKEEEFIALKNSDHLVPFGYNAKDASMFSLSLESIYCYMITGKSRSGKTNCLKSIIKAVSGKSDVCIIDFSNSELKAVCESANGKYLVTAEDMYNYWIELLPIFKERNQKKRQLISEGKDDNQIFEEMNKEKRIFIFVSDFAEFIRISYMKNEKFGTMNGFLENILEKGSLHNIFFIGCINSDESASVSSYSLYNIISSYKTGIHFGGNVFRQKVFDFSSMPFSEQSKTFKAGIGLSVSALSGEVSKIIIPDTRR